MNKVITSREELLAASKSIAAGQGLAALNMRAVAAAANVAVGSVYNYFPSKAELVTVTVQDIWRGIFHDAGSCTQSGDFCACVEWLFASIRTGAAEYPDFLRAHMSGFAAQDRKKARQAMEEAFSHMRASLEQVLERDEKVRPDAFGADLDRKQFVAFVFSSLMAGLAREESDCATLLAVIRRVLYA